MSDLKLKISNGYFQYRVSGIIKQKNKILLHKLITDEHWALVGGRVKTYEDSQEAIAREFKEELGYTIKIEKLLFTVENFFKYNNEYCHEIGMIYSLDSSDFITMPSGNFNGLENSKLIYRWFDIQEIKALTIKPDFLKEKLLSDLTSHEHIINRDSNYISFA